ncbi:MAG: glycosyltransferase N-terminal domain-containing protein, partial [Planctomycetota bacterium]
MNRSPDLAARRAALPWCLLYAAAAPLLLAYLLWRRLASPRPLPGLRAKLTGRQPPLPPGYTLIHGVSLGEVALMRPLVPLLEELFQTPCLICTSTGTGAQAAEHFFPTHQRRFLPFDAPWAVRRFLQEQAP